MKVIVTCSGGKDSVASLLWMREHGYKNFDIVFCDTQWEHELTYTYIKYLEEKLNIKFRFLKSKKYDGLIDLSRKKKRFPSLKARFCTIELKTIPMVDYILDEVQDDILVVQGIRGAESESRALMSSQCNYFKYYLEPYETNTTLLPKLERKLIAAKTQANKDKILKRIEKVKARLALGKEDPKYHSYRRKEVLAYCKKYATDVLRPVFDKSAQWVVDYSLELGVDLNPLYKMGMGRVGCYPCILANLMEIHQIAVRTPERIDEVAVYEDEIGSSFFGPKKIPKKYYKGIAPTIREVVAYADGKYNAGELFDDFSPTSCMSFYGICE